MAYEHLLALRAELVRQQLTGFVVPHTDEYQNEYLPPCAERLAWLTGFTGSAGTAIVLRDEAAMFVDGRYTLQVADQVDEKSFTLHNSGDTSPEEWLALRATPTDRIGYDPWLHTPQDLKRFQTATERVGAQLVPCVSNPIDAVWHDRPQPPSGVIKPHLLEFSGQSSQVKREIFGRRFLEDGIDAAIITAPDSIAWLLNIRGSDVPILHYHCAGLFYTPPGGSLCLSIRKKSPRACKRIWVRTFLLHDRRNLKLAYNSWEPMGIECCVIQPRPIPGFSPH